eukprot:GHVU01219847.1.p1 GENE.GHVU01219847.1~~GHVU01219847.1.p1  ORF type:complete len:276 (+),score=3.77 GHVU01219847.1:319-1146(+)
MNLPLIAGRAGGAAAKGSHEEGSLCPLCLQVMVRDLCCAVACGHVFHWSCVEGRSISHCPCCQFSPFGLRRLFFELGKPGGPGLAADAHGSGAATAPEDALITSREVAYRVEKLHEEKVENIRYQHYRVRYTNGNVFTGKHELFASRGPLENPIVNGSGEMKYSRGGSYSGKWRDGVPQGRGRKQYANNDVYEGSFEGKPINQGRLSVGNSIRVDRDHAFLRAHIMYMHTCACMRMRMQHTHTSICAQTHMRGQTHTHTHTGTQTIVGTHAYVHR